MAENTSKTLRNQIMYQIFPRNFSPEGTFRAVIPELDRIKELGTDIIWFTPIHPIGVVKRKGTLGSPYAIMDYRAVNPELGTIEDFTALVVEIHSRGMKCIIDVVYNHTSPDSVLINEHPEWFWHDDAGNPAPRVADWSDVVDLDYSNRDLWDYQIDTLKMWAGIVDGFRCDVAPLIPLEFWLEARRAVETVRPGALWLCESVEPRFITYMRSWGMTALSDSQLYQAFDISYEYDIFDEFAAYFRGEIPLSRYAESVNRQEYIYPDNYVKLRFLENHDRPRAASYLKTKGMLENATAFLFFQKGLTLIYAGQEMGAAHLPGLFDKDDVKWDDPENTDFSSLIRILSELKKDEIFTDSTYKTSAASDDVIIAAHIKNASAGCAGNSMAGIFTFSGQTGQIDISASAGIDGIKIPDGRYTNLLTGQDIEMTAGKMNTDGKPVIIRY